MIVFLLNQSWGDKHESGGDILCSQIIARSKGMTVAPLSIKNLILSSNKEMGFLCSDNIDPAKIKYNGPFIFRVYVLLTFIKRAIKTYFLLKKVEDLKTVYLTGDFICNTLPAWMIKRKKKNVKIVSNFFHRNPPPKKRYGLAFSVAFFSRLIQSISLKIIKRISDYIFVLSEVGKQELIKEGFDSEKIIISGAGLDKDIISKFKNNSKINNQLIFLGRLNGTKGIFDLIHILGKLNKLNANFKCKIVGTGYDFTIQELKVLAKKYSIENKIDFMGYVSEEVKYELLASSKALLLPSKEEGFSIVIQEALFLNTDAICYNLPALITLFGKCQGIHFTSLNDIDAFAIKVNNILNNQDIKKTTDIFPSWDDVYNIQSKFLK
jgi:glycosyltransferase involved in cell wall biosynthesis